MKKIVLARTGGPEELKLVEASDVTAGIDDVLVRVEAAGVNFLDVYQRKGIYEVALPITPGFEGIGEISAVGANVTAFKAGDRVAWISVAGSYASQVIVPATRAIKVPQRFSANDGLLFQAVTAQYLVREYGRITPGDTVLVHAAAGGVGQLLVQWVKHLGGVVIATASSMEKLETVRVLGADHLINYSNGDFVPQVLEVTGGRGVDLAYDAVGKMTLLKTIEALAARGMVVTYGAASGESPAIEPRTLVDKSVRLAGANIWEYIADADELQGRLEECVRGVEQGWLKMGEGRRYELSAAAQAHEDLEGRGTQGKLYLVP